MLARISILGIGKMGGAMALRLREQGHALSLWNRSAAKAEAVKAEDLPGACVVSESAAAAVAATAPDGMVVLVLSDTAACLATLDSIRDVLGGRTVINLTSGSPDDGRAAAAALPAGVAYMDGAYCGPPAKARQGAGVLFLSSEAEAEVDRLRPALGVLGELCYTGTKIGASRALDYAVVDLALVTYASLFSNMEMLEREGVDASQLHEHAAKRLSTVPGALKPLHRRCAGERTDAAYLASPVATLGTIHAFWASRLPYYDAHGIPPVFPKAMAGLCEAAATAGGGDHWAADVSRMQEAMRPPAKAAEP